MKAHNERRSRSPRWRQVTLVLLLALIPIGLIGIPKAHAPGEVYTLYTLPGRIQESNTPGETLILNITNAAIGSTYRETFIVTDPSGFARGASNTTTATSSSIVLSVSYPKGFTGGASIDFVGTYAINVAQNQPSNKPSVATGQFQVGLTDKTIYQRTGQISIEVTAYAASENITTTLIQGTTPAPGFPKWQLADTSGNLIYSWRVPPSTPLGSYTLTLIGSVTTKTVTDTQTLTITATSVVIPGITCKSSSISRSLTQQLILAPQYLDGQRSQTGQTIIEIDGPDGSNVANVTAGYDNLTGAFRAPYYIPRTATTGIWIATIDQNTFDDGYGNTGPAAAVSVGFNVQAATFNVSIINAAIGQRTYTPSDIIPIYASITYPDRSPFSTGPVTAKITRNGVPVGTPITLSYITGQQAWAGTYQVSSNDPSGIWVITVDGSDQFGDTGEGSFSATVNVPPQTPTTWFTTSNFLLITAIIAGAILAVLLWALFISRRRVTRRQVKLDLKVVDKEVERIENSQFFQNVKKQVDQGSLAKEPPPDGHGEAEDKSS